MFIKSLQYGIVEAACGITLQFDILRPKPIKIANIVSSVRESSISTLSLENVNTSYIQEDMKVLVQSPQFLYTDTLPAIDSSFTGSFDVQSINETSVTYYQNLIDFDTQDCIGVLYLANNIRPKNTYLINFAVESVVPSSSTASLSPVSYTISGNDIFQPITSLKIITKSSAPTKVLIKMSIQDANSNDIILTDYYQVLVSDALQSSCEIISENDIYSDTVELNKNNNWTYTFQGYRLLKFIPYNDNEISLSLPQKNRQLLPNRGLNNKLKIVVDPIKMIDKKVSIDQIRSAITAKYNNIENIYAVANLNNKSYDIIISDNRLDNNNLSDVVVALVPPVSGEEVKFSDVASAVPYFADISDVPSIGLVKYNNTTFGELQFNDKIYDNENMFISKDGEEYQGSITAVYDGLIQLSKL
jgi:hypothetical protein